MTTRMRERDQQDAAQAAWQAVLEVLQTDLSTADFQKRLAPTRPVALQDGRLTVAAPDAYARDWLTARLARLAGRHLTGILNAPGEVQFTTASDPSPSQPNGSPPLTPEQAWLSLIDAEPPDSPLQAARFLAFYHGRVILAVPNPAAQQALASGERTDLAQTLTEFLAEPVTIEYVIAGPAEPAPNGQPPVPAPNEEASPPALSEPEAEIVLKPIRRSLRDILTRPRSVVVVSAYLLRWLPYLGVDEGWFLVAMRQAYYQARGEKVAAGNCGQTFTVSRRKMVRWSGLGDQKVWGLLKTLEQPDQRGRYLGWFLQAAPGPPGKSKIYTFRADMPLTPGDAAALAVWLTAAGIKARPLEAVQHALDRQPGEIWPYPPPAPSARHKKLRPAPQTVREVVLAAAGLDRTDPRFLPLQQLADELQLHLQSPTDNLLITHYFLLEWLRRLGRLAGWLVTLLRDRGYIDHHTGRRRDRIRLSGGYPELAALLAVSERQVESWLPPLADMVRRESARRTNSHWARHQAKRALVGHFLEKDGQVDWSGNGGTRYEFKVRLEDPLTPEHAEITRTLETLLHESLVSGDLAVIETLAQDLVRVSHRSKNGRSADHTGEPKGGPRATQLEMPLVREPHPGRSAFHTQKAPADPRTARLKGLLVKYVNPKALKEIKQLVQEHLERHRAEPAPAEHPGGGEPKLPEIWDWERLLAYSGAPKNIRTEILASAALKSQFLGQVLYAYEHRARGEGPGIQTPFKFAVRRRHDPPPPEYQELAALSPGQLAAALRSRYRDSADIALSQTARRVARALAANDFLAVITEVEPPAHGPV